MMATSPELISKHMASATTRSRRSSSYGSSSDDSNISIPETIMSASLQSFPESDNYSMSSSIQSLSPVSSPRSIFGSYWSSPMHKNTLEETNANDDEARLQMLQLPLVNDLDTDGADSSSASANKIFQAPIISVEQKTCFDDASIDYQAALPSTPTRTPRRKILPTPPPPTAISSSLIPPMRKFQHQPFLQRKSFSATALLRGSHPHQSCLRKSRYSCSAIVTGSVTATSVMGRLHHGSCNHGYHDLYHHNPQPAVISRGNRPDDPRDELKKSVSFYSQVSVLEFSVPPDQRRSQKGWSNYFL
mmetsp:Transcript_15133/g.24612  ORF Transcript_15133/g.24612 Transcript_15133/m.24612 type:complete len:303 (+) Transcript_15133:153-1061(+)